MAFSVLDNISSASGIFQPLGAMRAAIGSVTTSYGFLVTVNADLATQAFAEVGISLDNNRYFRNQAANAWILYFSSSNFSVGNLSPLFTAAISNPTTAPAIAFTLSSSAAGTVLNNSSGAANPPSYTANIALGETGVTGGSIQFRSATGGSGAIIMQLAGASGNYNFNLPLSAGTTGQVLTSQGGGSTAMIWTTISSGGFVTADNGLTANTATNVQLGGTLIKNTTIATASFTLTVRTTTNGVRPFYVSSTTETAILTDNSATSNATINAQNNDAGTTINAFSAGGNAVVIQTSGSGIAVTASTSDGPCCDFALGNGSTNTVLANLKLSRGTTGTAANGIGFSIDMYVESSGGTSHLSNQLITKWSNATAASRTSEFSITGVNSTTTATILTLAGTGALRLNKYGVGSFTGTVAFSIGVDSSGNLIEFPGAGGSGVTAGIYTPTLTNAANVTSSNAFDCQYLAVTDPNSGTQVVTVSGKFVVTFTTGGATTRLGISIPIASALSSDQEVGGVAGSNSLTNGSFAVRADTTNDRAEFYATAPGSGTSETYWFTFTYVVNIP